MKRTVQCCRCGIQSSPNKWRSLGWIKVELTYTDGNRWREYTCGDCRKKTDQKATEIPASNQ